MDFNGVVSILNEPLRCQKGIVSHDQSFFDQVYIADLHLKSGEASNIYVEEIIVNNSLSNGQVSYLNEIFTNTIESQHTSSTLITSPNAFFDHVEVDNGNADKLYVRDLQTSNLTSLNGNFIQLEGEGLNYVDGIFHNELISFRNSSSNLNCDHARFNEMQTKSFSNDIGHINHLDANECVIKTLNVHDSLTVPEATIQNINASNVNISSIKLDDLESTNALFHDLKVDTASLSNITLKTLVCNEGKILNISGDTITSMHTINATDLNSSNITSDQATFISTSSCNLDVDILLKINGEATFMKNADIKQKLTVSTLKATSCEVNENLTTQNLTVNNDFTFNGDVVRFLDKASFTRIKEVNFIDVQFDVDVGRYLQTRHSFMELGGDPLNKTIQFNPIISDWYVIPFYKLERHYGGRGLDFNLANGLVRCQQSGVYMIDVYVEFSDSYSTTGQIGVVLNDNDDLHVTRDDVSKLQSLNFGGKKIKGQFTTYIEQNKYIHVCSRYDTESDPKKEYLTTLDTTNSYMSIMLINATL